MNAIIFSAILGVVMMLSAVFFKQAKSFLPLAIASVSIILAVAIAEFMGVSLFTINSASMFSFNRFGLICNVLLTACTLLYLLLSGTDIEDVGSSKAEYFALLLFVLCGMYTVCNYNNLIMLFIGIEIISIPLYVLTSADKRNLKSNEAGLKYFLMGAFSTGILLLGIAFLYGGLGTFNLSQANVVAKTITGANDVAYAMPTSWTVVGMMLVFAALSFKVSLAPFHFWTPDVYDGAPTVFTSFMATVVKAAFFIAFLILFHNLFNTLQHKWIQYAAITAALTFVIGNITAVFQQSVKRMLAYSSIAQAGFMLLAIITQNNTAYQGILLYAVAYSVASMGMFGVLTRLKEISFEGLNGLGKSHPLLAGCATVFLLSLAGIPLTAGFFAKYYMLLAAIQTGLYKWLIILALLAAAVSIYYYFRAIQAMYFKPITITQQVSNGSSLFRFSLLLCAVIIITLGIMPYLITDRL